MAAGVYAGQETSSTSPSMAIQILAVPVGARWLRALGQVGNCFLDIAAYTHDTKSIRPSPFVFKPEAYTPALVNPGLFGH